MTMFNINWSSICYRAYGFAACAHREQRRKYTEEPYIVHPLAVANVVSDYGGSDNAISAALMHDVLEDTDVKEEYMRWVFGDAITNLVLEVTDASRPSQGNRETRKAIDRDHLSKSSPEGALIKLADLIDNTKSIVKYDKNFAKTYLREKELLLPILRHACSIPLWNLAKRTLIEAQKQIGEEV